MFDRKFQKRVYAFLGTLAGTVLCGGAFAAYALWPSNVERGYEPTQPLAYSHRLHAGDLQIECLFCHSRADSDRHAAVPPLSTCMKCHTEVQGKDSRGAIKAATRLLLEHWERRAPLCWVKVHDLADFVYFDHARHVSWFDPALGRSVERMACQECHGPIEEMEVVRRQNSLKMGWCLACHREPVRPDSSPGLASRGPTHCSACHR